MLALRGRVSTAELRASEADQRTEEAKRRIAELDKQSAGLKSETAQLTAANLALEKEISPRRLSGQTANALSYLDNFPGRLVEVRSYTGDTEGLLLATAIIRALEKTNLRVLDNRLTLMPSGSIAFGVAVDGPDAPLVDQLRSIFRDGKLLATTSLPLPTGRGSAMFNVAVPRVPPAAIIVVGPKPLK